MLSRTIPLTAAGHIYREPLYRINTEATALERELLQCRPLRRLKHIRHAGAGALLGPITHSRLEHTLGVWSLTAALVPEDMELRIAALLHDIGHLPFSHSIEKSLGLDHHRLTEERITGGEVAAVLRKHHFVPEKIVDLLGRDTPLTHESDFMGIDHLDSFARDNWYMGKDEKPAREWIGRIRMNGLFVETDPATALLLARLVYEEHITLLEPYTLAADALLSQAALKALEGGELSKEEIENMTDEQLLGALHRSAEPQTKKWLNALLWEPHTIRIADSQEEEGGFEAAMRKLYKKIPLTGGRPVTETNEEARNLYDSLERLKRSYYIYV